MTIKGRGERSITGVYGSVRGAQNKSVPGTMEMQRVATKVDLLFYYKAFC